MHIPYNIVVVHGYSTGRGTGVSTRIQTEHSCLAGTLCTVVIFSSTMCFGGAYTDLSTVASSSSCRHRRRRLLRETRFYGRYGER